MSRSEIDIDKISQLAGLLGDNGLTDIEVELGDLKIKLSARQAETVYVSQAPAQMQAPTPAAAAPAPAAQEAPAAAQDLSSHPGAVTSPMVGTVYLAPEPGAADFIKEGDTVSIGQTLLIVEAMKTMNPITAQAAGTVKKIMVSNEQPVEFGETLVIIE